MPAAYAHHRFGSECIATMPPKFQKACETHRELFDFGVHGPDIFFYHRPLTKNPVNSFGYAMHHRTGRDFFEETRAVFRSEKNSAAMMAYLLGFLAHFALDSSCHAYINRLTKQSDMSHNYIESQYEAFLMRMDGKEPISVDRSQSLHPSPRTAEVIARFFPIATEDVLKANKGQARAMRLLYSPTEKKKKAVQKLLRTIGIEGDFADLFIDNDEAQGCAESNRRIFELQQQALERYPALMTNYVRYLNGREELIEDFDLDFEGKVHRHPDANDQSAQTTTEGL